MPSFLSRILVRISIITFQLFMLAAFCPSLVTHALARRLSFFYASKVRTNTSMRSVRLDSTHGIDVGRVEIRLLLHYSVGDVDVQGYGRLSYTRCGSPLRALD